MVDAVDVTIRPHEPRMAVVVVRDRRSSPVGIEDTIEVAAVDVARRVDLPSEVGTIRVRRKLQK